MTTSSIPRKPRRPRISADKYHELAASRSFEWLGDEPPGVRVPTPWRCPKGHVWLSRYDDIRSGNGCPRCRSWTLKTDQDYHSLAEKRGVQWLGKLPTNTVTKTIWCCANGHTFDMTFQKLAVGHGCIHCARMSSKTASEYRNLAVQRNYQWIGEAIPANVHTPTLWLCAKGHSFTRTYNEINTEYGCQQCSSRRLPTASEYAELGAKMGLIWIGPMPDRPGDKTGWQCGCGNVFYSRWYHIQKGIGCPECKKVKIGNALRKPAKNYHALADSLGVEFIGPSVNSVFTKATWRCPKGHEFQMDYHHLKRGYGCPECADFVNGKPVSGPQRTLATMLNGDLNRIVQRYAIDVAIVRDGVNIGIEFDCWYWHKDRTHYDDQRDKALISAGWRVLRVKSAELLPSLPDLEAAISRILAGSQYEEIVLKGWGD